MNENEQVTQELEAQKQLDWEAIQSEPDLRFERIIQVRGRVTTVVAAARVGGDAYQGFGAAVCDQTDEPDPETGLRLATGRAIEDLGRQVKKDGWRRVQRHPSESSPPQYTVNIRVVRKPFGPDWLRRLARFK